jgi:hypothetical protein
MRRRYFLYGWHCLLMILFRQAPIFSQIKWDGGGGDGRWSNSANWSGDVLPTASDDVVLDNTFIFGNYTIEADAAITIRSLTIQPSLSHHITLLLPAGNTAVPAFTVSNITIDNGGVFRNASGADSGQPLIITDSLRINNGGRFVQNTDRSHAAIVTVLSAASGTEEGIFEFDLPGASNTISLSGRRFGKLVFSSNAMPGIANYTATGTNAIHIRSNLEVGEGVTLSLNMSDTLFIHRDLVQQGGTINLGNSSRTLTTIIGRHLLQSSTGTILETGTAIPEIILQGKSPQQINCQGTIQNNIVFTIDNASGVTLNNKLSLPYLLRIKKGRLNTSFTHLLTLLPGCSVQAETSYINGPVRVELTSFTSRYQLPLGKGNTINWLALKNAYGHFTAEYFNSDPHLLADSMGTGLHHLSNNEYWSIKADAYPLPSAQIELPFTAGSSITVTDMDHLRVASLQNEIWVNAGNTDYTGTAGSQGSVTSNEVDHWNNGSTYFTLASSMPAGSLSLNEKPPVSINRTNNADFRLVSISSSHTLTCQSPEKSRLTIRVTSINGTLIKSYNAFVEKGMNTLILHPHQLPAGIYCIQAFFG